jgi:hypothetical protein
MIEKNPHFSWLDHIGKARDLLIIIIRHKLPFLYAFLDLVNKIYGHIFFRGFKKAIKRNSWEGLHTEDTVKVITENDVSQLVTLVQSASEKSRNLFNPHEISEDNFRQLIRAPYYIAIGYFTSGNLTGYAFIKLYFPRKAFAGYFVADTQQGKGIGKHLFKILQSIANETSFELYTHVKEENLASIRVSSDYVIQQKIPGGYLVLKHIADKK